MNNRGMRLVSFNLPPPKDHVLRLAIATNSVCPAPAPQGETSNCLYYCIAAYLRTMTREKHGEVCQCYIQSCVT